MACRKGRRRKSRKEPRQQKDIPGDDGSQIKHPSIWLLLRDLDVEIWVEKNSSGQYQANSRLTSKKNYGHLLTVALAPRSMGTISLMLRGFTWRGNGLLRTTKMSQPNFRKAQDREDVTLAREQTATRRQNNIEFCFLSSARAETKISSADGIVIIISNLGTNLLGPL